MTLETLSSERQDRGDVGREENGREGERGGDEGSTGGSSVLVEIGSSAEGG